MGKDFSINSGAYYFHCATNGVCNHDTYETLNLARAARDRHELKCHKAHVINYRDKVVA